MAKQILAKEPRNSEAHYLLAKAYRNDGKAELALMEMKNVNNLNDFQGYCKEKRIPSEYSSALPAVQFSRRGFERVPASDKNGAL